MIHEAENWSFRDFPEVADGDSFVQCNMVRAVPDTTVFTGKTGLKFLHCNIINCDLPADSETEQCNTAQNEYTFDDIDEDAELPEVIVE